MTETIHIQRARDLCAQMRMLGSPTRGDHLGAKQSGTIIWERDGWPAVEAKLAQAFAEAEAKLVTALRVAEVAFDCLDPANHQQTTDAELAQLITTARQSVSDALKGNS